MIITERTIIRIVMVVVVMVRIMIMMMMIAYCIWFHMTVVGLIGNKICIRTQFCGYAQTGPNLRFRDQDRPIVKVSETTDQSGHCA
jgi:hypothetical protein